MSVITIAVGGRVVTRGLLDMAAGDAHSTVAVGAKKVAECGAARITLEGHAHETILARVPWLSTAQDGAQMIRSSDGLASG